MSWTPAGQLKVKEKRLNEPNWDFICRRDVLSSEAQALVQNSHIVSHLKVTELIYNPCSYTKRLSEIWSRFNIREKSGDKEKETKVPINTSQRIQKYHCLLLNITQCFERGSVSDLNLINRWFWMTNRTKHSLKHKNTPAGKLFGIKTYEFRKLVTDTYLLRAYSWVWVCFCDQQEN